MDFKKYLDNFQNILQNENNISPYDDPDFLNYTKLNWSRMNRWMKVGKLNEGVLNAINTIEEEQFWIIITEPWCGDAAHIVPFLELMSRQNDKITVQYELRDREPHRIDNYLTNGGKAIPKLIIKNKNGVDLAIWGPRPEACQAYYNKMKKENVEIHELKIALQEWYNKDAGNEIMIELTNIIKSIIQK